ncbi:MAG: hypothetical protein HKP10_07550 [Kiritimatiellales bacterium]|nr:hypothetical protein [Kiritimatiellales bacterium]
MMCTEPDFDLPEAFVDAMKKSEAQGEGAALTVRLAPMEQQLVQKIAEQTGFSVGAAAAALLGEGLAAFRSRGIVY